MGECLLTSTFSPQSYILKDFLLLFKSVVKLLCSCLFYYLSFHREFGVTILFLDLRYFYCVGVAHQTKTVPSPHLMTGHCGMFSLGHKTVVSTEVFIGIGFGRVAILGLEHLLHARPWGLRGVGVRR